MISYTSDFELALYNALEKVFSNLGHLGYYFHFSFNIGTNFKSRLLTKINNENNNNTNTDKINKKKEEAENF